MIHLIVAFALLVILFIACRRLCQYPSWSTLIALLTIGAVSGLLLDYTLGYRVGWWSYLHHDWYSSGYWAYLVPAWAMVVAIFVLFYKLLERLIWNPIIRLTIYFGVIPLQQEFMGINQGSWSYTANPALIGIGWILLLDSCVLVKHCVDWFTYSDMQVLVYQEDIID